MAFGDFDARFEKALQSKMQMQSAQSTAALQNAAANQKNASTNAFSAKSNDAVNRFNASTNRQEVANNYDVNSQNAATNRFNAETNLLDANNRYTLGQESNAIAERDSMRDSASSAAATSATREGNQMSYDVGMKNAGTSQYQAETDRLKSYKRGTARVPGKGDGDRVPAMLEPGEAILNKKAAGMIGRDKIAKANAKGNQMRQKEDTSKVAAMLKKLGMV